MTRANEAAIADRRRFYSSKLAGFGGGRRLHAPTVAGGS